MAVLRHIEEVFCSTTFGFNEAEDKQDFFLDEYGKEYVLRDGDNFRHYPYNKEYNKPGDSYTWHDSTWNSVTVQDTLDVAEDIRHMGESDNYMRFETEKISLNVIGNEFCASDATTDQWVHEVNAGANNIDFVHRGEAATCQWNDADRGNVFLSIKDEADQDGSIVGIGSVTHPAWDENFSGITFDTYHADNDQQPSIMHNTAHGEIYLTHNAYCDQFVDEVEQWRYIQDGNALQIEMDVAVNTIKFRSASGGSGTAGETLVWDEWFVLNGNAIFNYTPSDTHVQYRDANGDTYCSMDAADARLKMGAGFDVQWGYTLTSGSVSADGTIPVKLSDGTTAYLLVSNGVAGW